MRQTSIAVFHEIQESGALSRMRWLTYECLYAHGPLTGSEVDERLKGLTGGRDNYHKRLSELERLGVAIRGQTRPCRITGRECEEWDVTDQLPKPVTVVPKPSTADLVQALKEMRAAYVAHPRKFSESFVKLGKWLAFLVEE